MLPDFDKLAIGLSLISAAYSLPRPQDSPLIIGGAPASAGEFPFIVSLQTQGSHFCGGTLIQPNIVITAAHCSTPYPAEDVQVRAGSTSWKSGGQVTKVKKIVVHPKYDSQTMVNDLAIWHLESEFSGTGIEVAELPQAGTDPSEGTKVTVSGWGLEQQFGNTLSPALQKASISVVDRERCQQSYGKEPNTPLVTDEMICAATMGKDACQGDSGGPLVDGKGTLVGIVSWGVGCASPEYPGVYTRVGNYVKWIADNM